MDTIGLLAAWVAVISMIAVAALVGLANLLLPPVERWRARTNPLRAQKRINKLYADLELSARPDNAYIADLVAAFGTLLVLVTAAGVMAVVAIQLLDLGPALLASTLPFNVNSKLFTRFTGCAFLVVSYYLICRIAWTAMRIRAKILPRQSGFAQRALDEIAQLRALDGEGATRSARSGVRG